MRHKSRRHQEHTEPGIECDAHGRSHMSDRLVGCSAIVDGAKESGVYFYATHSSRKRVAAALVLVFAMRVSGGHLHFTS